MNKVVLAKWGNSVGVRIPVNVVESVHAYVGEEFSVKPNRQGGFTLIPISDSQRGWTEAFNAVAGAQDDQALMGDFGNEFDEDEWTW